MALRSISEFQHSNAQFHCHQRLKKQIIIVYRWYQASPSIMYLPSQWLTAWLLALFLLLQWLDCSFLLLWCRGCLLDQSDLPVLDFWSWTYVVGVTPVVYSHYLILLLLIYALLSWWRLNLGFECMAGWELRHCLRFPLCSGLNNDLNLN